MLPVAGVKFLVGRALRDGADPKERPEPVERVEAPVEAEHELVGVRLEVLRGYSVVNAQQPRLEVAEYEMDEREKLFGDLWIKGHLSRFLRGDRRIVSCCHVLTFYRISPTLFGSPPELLGEITFGVLNLVEPLPLISLALMVVPETGVVTNVRAGFVFIFAPVGRVAYTADPDYLSFFNSIPIRSVDLGANDEIAFALFLMDRHPPFVSFLSFDAHGLRLVSERYVLGLQAVVLNNLAGHASVQQLASGADRFARSELSAVRIFRDPARLNSLAGSEPNGRQKLALGIHNHSRVGHVHCLLKTVSVIRPWETSGYSMVHVDRLTVRHGRHPDKHGLNFETIG